MRKKTTLFDGINYVFMLLLTLSILYPFYNLLVTSFSLPNDILTQKLQLWPKHFTFDSYRIVFSNDDVAHGYVNTIIRTVFGTTLSIVVTLCAAYALSQRGMPLRGAITVYFLFTMFFSGGLIPTYLWIRDLGLVNSRLSLILPGVLGVFNLVVMRNYIQGSIDKSLEESAAMDGAGPIRILAQIIAPLCKPVLATIALWTMVGHWNAWFDAMIYINDPDKQVLQMLLRKIMFNYDDGAIGTAKAMLGLQVNDVNPNTLKAAFIFVTIGPIIFVYPFLQRYFVKGIMIGALKG
ncbi:MAG: carbohydrate ABC transporter permease [Paenibacillaceae bacterium]|nr:carbohydrate ABC transporter permease [Paenibacillaceae bacterium]